MRLSDGMGWDMRERRSGLKTSKSVARLTIAGILAVAFAITNINAASAGGWAVVDSPNQGSGSSYLFGVACISSMSCTAVGYYLPAGSTIAQTLVESWNGTAWTITPSPNQGSGNNVLNAVACASSVSCVAVGYFEFPGRLETLVETWNGTTWTITPSPNVGADSNELNGVACLTSTSCVAVGSYQDASLANQTLVETWNGSAWTVAISPNRASAANALEGISCKSATSCIAVGYSQGSSIAQTLVESWNGTA
jgi:hypothetical protein